MNENMKKILGIPEIVIMEKVEIPIYKFGIDELEHLAALAKYGDANMSEMTTEHAQAIAKIVKIVLRNSGAFGDATDEELGKFPLNEESITKIMNAVAKVNGNEVTSDAKKDKLEQIRAKQKKAGIIPS